jgi:hypothetical protein
MRFFFSFLCLFLLAVNANAGVPRTWHLCGQFGGKVGYSDNYSILPAAAGYLPYFQSVVVPDGNAIIRIVGTITVRAPGAVLMEIRGANGAYIWTGEVNVTTNWQPVTVPISVEIPATWFLSGLIYVNYEETNFADFSYPDGDFWEYQLTLFSA